MVGCFGTKRRSPQISPPVHLLLRAPEVKFANHIFKSKTVSKSRPCQLCHQPIRKRGVACSSCKYTCHEACEPNRNIKETSSSAVQPQRNGKKSEESSQESMSQVKKGSSQGPAAETQTGMTLSSVTERILSLSFDDNVQAASYRVGLRDAASLLRTKHGEKYAVFNLSAPRRVLSRHNPQVVDFGWPSTLAPPLERICGICKRMDDWLQSDPKNVIVLHSRRGLQRIGVAVAAYMQYVSVCGGDDQALERFAMQRFMDQKVPQSQFQPSDLRYISYFWGLLSGSIRVNAAPLFLDHLSIVGIPNYDLLGGCKPFLKIYESRIPVYTSGIYNVTGGCYKKFTLSLEKGLQLRGDILIRCYNRTTQSPGRELIFSCQFHTCAVIGDRMIVPRSDLDYACKDNRFPVDGGVIFYFSDGASNRVPPSAPVLHPVEIHGGDPVTRWDSLDTFGCHTDANDADDDASSDEDSTGGVTHIQGPVDCSLYATVSKKKLAPNSPEPLVVQTQPPYTPKCLNSSHDSGISSAGIRGGPREAYLSGSSSSPPHSARSNLDADTPSPALSEMPTARVGAQEMLELDQALSGMLMNVKNIRDVPAEHKPRDEVDLDSIRVDFELKSPKTKKSVEFNETVKMGKSEVKPLSNGVNGDMDGPIPYHARSDSKPFTYGMPDGSESPSIHRRNSKDSLVKVTAPGLSSPSLVRKFSNASDRGAPSLRVPLPQISPGLPESNGTMPSPRLARKLSGNNLGVNLVPPSATSTPTPARSPISPVPDGRNFSPPPLMKQNSDSNYVLSSSYKTNSSYNWSPENYYGTISSPKTVRRNASFRMDSKPHTPTPLRLEDTISDIASSITDTSRCSDAGSTWLQRQQDKLREKRECEKRSDRTPKETKLMRELRNVQTGRVRAPRPDDGYLSDTTQFSELGTSREGSPDLYGSVSLQLSMQSDVESSKCASPLKQPLSPPGSPLMSHRSASRETSGRYMDGERTLTRHKSDISERSFVAVKREHDERKYSETRDDSVTSWDSETSPRPTTPAFPVGARTPYVHQQGLPPKSPGTMRKDRSPSPGMGFGTMDGSSRRSSLSEPADVSPVYVKFAKDTSKFWYKPSISREDAINTLKYKQPGTFVVRDSSSFPGAFGLALKVASPPSHLTDPSPNDLVRHFLIEPTSRGVKLKGCPDEPVFGSLSALVYQHSVKPLALPCKLLLPEYDVTGVDVTEATSGSPQSLQHGAACNVFYLFTMDCESLTGPQAIARCIQRFNQQSKPSAPAVVHFKVSSQGITLTDHQRKLFFRRHYPLSGLTHCGLDVEDRKWPHADEKGNVTGQHRYFGFVARKPGSSTDNQVHIFAEYEEEQPASAIINFVNRVLTSTNRNLSII